MPKYSVEIKGIQPLIEHSINSMMLSKSNKVKSSTHDPAEEAEPEDLQGLRGIIHASGGIRPGQSRARPMRRLSLGAPTKQAVVGGKWVEIKR